MEVQSAINRFEEISDNTGILTNEIKAEPNSEERDELWDITCVFVKQIYKLDIDNNARQDEINQLCHYAIVALHWNDLMIDDERFAHDNGRFRRDTIALAACLFTRLSRDYEHYHFVKGMFIMPHTKGSLLLWTLRSIIDCNQDNLFNMFKPDFAKEALDEYLDQTMKYGWLKEFASVDDDHPLVAVWFEVYRRFNSGRIPYQFVLNYIWNSSGIPGGLGLLSEDREMNKAYLKEQLEHKQFPSDWSFHCDLAFVYLFFASETDQDLSEKEIIHIKHKICEWLSGDDEEKKDRSEKIYLQAFDLFKQDKSKDRFAFSLENIRTYFYNLWSDETPENINKHLSLILKGLVTLSEADEKIIQEEYELVEEIRSNWGIDIKLFDEEVEALCNEKTIETTDEVKEEITSEYLENYPGDLYCENSRWDSSEWSDYPMNTKPFANVFKDGEYKYDDLFRRFTQDEVNLIVSKIKSTGCLIYLSFVRKILSKKFDMRGLKDPFWFDPFLISGAFNGAGGLFYFEQNGFYQNTFDNEGEWTDPTDMNLVAHVDCFSDLTVEKGYNNYWDNLLDGEDEEKVTTLDVEWYNPSSGNSGFLSFIQTNGPEYPSTLPIVKAIWDNAWSRVVEKSKAAGCFLLGPPPMPEFFNSWDELLDWAKTDDSKKTPGKNEDIETVKTKNDDVSEESSDEEKTPATKQRRASGKKGLTVSGRMSVGRFEKEFEKLFGVRCEVKKGGRYAPDDSSLASLRPKDFKGPKTVDFSVRGNMKVNSVKKKFNECFGLNLQLFIGSRIAPDDATLASLKK